ncbi:MAG: PAS domain S-box protein, partial [Planctomycetota bacterium]
MTENKTHPDQADDVRKLRRTLIFVTVSPLLAFYTFILYYVPSGVLKTGWVATILIAVMLLMLAGIQMMFRLIRMVDQAAHRDGADSPDIHREPPIQGIRSIRHTVAEAAALIGAIPLLALGYLVVHYVLCARTTESVLLIACIVAAVIVLGIERINSLARRIIAVAAAARSVRMETRLPARDSGRDEIGTLSVDLAHIAENLSTHRSELHRAKSFVERLPHPMLVVDAAGMINYANRAALILLNYEERELMGKRASSLFVREEEPGWILGECGDAARENIWRCKDGTHVPVSVRIGALSEGGGGDSVMIATDISGRESAQSALRESERRYRGLFDDSPISLWEEDMSGIKRRIDELRASGVSELGKYLDEHPDEVAHCASLLGVINVNKATLVLYGADSVEKFRSDTLAFFPKEVLAIFKNEILAIAEGKTSFECDTIAKTVDGGEKYVHLSWSVLPGHEETYGHVLLTIMDITAHTRVEKALRTSEAQLSNALKMAHAGHWEYDVGSDTFTFNDNFYRIFRTTAEKVGGYKMSSADYARRFCHPDDAPMVAKEVQAAIDASDPNHDRQFEHRILRADGEVGYMAVRFFITKDRQGRTVMTYGVNQDITERKRAEETLRESEERFQQLFDNMADGVAIYQGVDEGQNFVIVDMNKTGQALSKVSLDEAVGRRVTEVFPGVERVGLLDVFRRVWRTGQPEHHPLMEYADGRIVQWVENYVYRLPSGLIVAIYSDTSEKHQAEQALQESEERYHTMMEQAADGVFLHDETGRLLDVNRKACQYLGYTREELLSKSIADIDPTAIQDGKYELWGKIIAGEEYTFEGCHLRKDGIVIPVEVTLGPVLLPHGPAILGIVRNITERKLSEEKEREMERRLLHSQKLESLGVLAGGIAHDFNNLLTAILGNMDLALDDLSPLSPARQSIEEAIHATKRAEALTRQMLAYSGKGRFIIADLDLSELVEENAYMLKAALSKNVKLNLRPGRGIPPISADAGQIQQVVMNLITNASESMGEQAGIVALSTGVMDCDDAHLSRSRLEEKPAPGRYVFLEVTDTGCGMDGETQGRIFDPFFTTKFTGRGLGMSAVLGIVRGHGGAIMVESEVGKGSTIRVLFPVSKTASMERGPREKAAKGRLRDAGKPPLSGAILIVDDEEMVRRPCAAMVTHAGYRALTAAGGDEAVALFRDHADEIVCV